MEKYKWESKVKESQVNLGGERRNGINKDGRNIFMFIGYMKTIWIVKLV